MRLINGLLAPAFLFSTLVANAQLSQASDLNSGIQITSEHKSSSQKFWANLQSALRGQKINAAVGDLNILVKDNDGIPVAGATVLVGSAEGQPFAGNMAQTDTSGAVSFTNGALQGQALPITASLPGYTTVSLFNNSDNSVAITLVKNPDARDYGFMRGRLSGFPAGYGWDKIEAGIFIPATGMDAFVNFDIQNFISSYIVKMDIYGQRDIPGNLVMPKQKKFWGFIPIDLNKPDFVMPLPAGLNAHMAGIVGAAPLGDVMGAVQNGDFLQTVNLMNITHVGWTTNRVNVHGDENFDVAANQAIEPRQVTAKLNNVPKQLDAIALSLYDPSGDRGDFVATDVKTIKAEDMQKQNGAMALGMLKQGNPANAQVFVALFEKAKLQDKNSRSIVGSLRSVGANKTLPFEQFLQPLQLVAASNGNHDFQFTPAANGNLVPNLTMVNLISEKKNALTMGLTRTILWSAVVRGNASSISLPNLGRPVLPAPDTANEEKFYLEATALRSGAAQDAGLDLQESIRNVQDVSSLKKAF